MARIVPDNTDKPQPYDAAAISTRNNFSHLLSAYAPMPKKADQKEPTVIYYTTESLSKGNINGKSNVVSAGDGLLSAEQKAVMRESMDEIEAVCNVRFVEVPPKDAKLVIFAADSVENGKAGGVAHYPGTTDDFRNLVIDRNDCTGVGKNRGWTKKVMTHELLHTLGLQHPHDSRMRFDMDSLNSTALSYKGSDEKKVGGPAIPRQWDMPETSLQPLDIAALQHLYGKNTGHNPENTLYHLGDKRVSFTIDDAGGFNVISARGYEGKKGEGVRLDLRNENPGHMSIVGGTRTWIADGTHIQGAQGSNGDDRIFSGGHGYKYHLEGGEGKDTFYISRHSKTELLDYRMAEGDKLVFHKGEFDNVKLYHNKSDNSIYIQAEHKDGHISEVLINGGEHNEVMAQLKTDHPELRIEDKGQISTLKLKAMEQCTKLNNELVAKGVTNRTPFLERAFEMHNAVAGAIVSGAVDAFNRGVGLDSDTRAARTSRGERPAPGSPPIERGEFDHEFFVAPGAKKSSPAR